MIDEIGNAMQLVDANADADVDVDADADVNVDADAPCISTTLLNLYRTCVICMPVLQSLFPL